MLDWIFTNNDSMLEQSSNSAMQCNVLSVLILSEKQLGYLTKKNVQWTSHKQFQHHRVFWVMQCQEFHLSSCKTAEWSMQSDLELSTNSQEYRTSARGNDFIYSFLFIYTASKDTYCACIQSVKIHLNQTEHRVKQEQKKKNNTEIVFLWARLDRTDLSTAR